MKRFGVQFPSFERDKQSACPTLLDLEPPKIGEFVGRSPHHIGQCMKCAESRNQFITLTKSEGYEVRREAHHLHHTQLLELLFVSAMLLAFWLT